MISFYPGPSRIHDALPRYVKDAARDGIMSINHRSEVFVALSQKTTSLLKQRLNIPKDYTVYFTSSATECWEIIAQSLLLHESYHFYNGAFGKKWFEYTSKINKNAVGLPFDRETEINPDIKFSGKQNIICITQNETSNGTQVSNAILKKIRAKNPGHLIAIDATSSMAGIALDFNVADVWFASIQKCFGLPAGMGIMICSPKAIKQAKILAERNHYNSLLFMHDMMINWQTSYTPNVLFIYLLMRVLENSESIASVNKETVRRYKLWEEFLKNQPNLKPLVRNKKVRSHTVIPIEGTPEFIKAIKTKASKHGFLLGEGYGDLKSTTFRIANFPALKLTEHKRLMKFLTSAV